MKKMVLIVAIVGSFLLPRPASALSANELLALVAMPLAVAAVSEVSGVPPAELASFVTALNLGGVTPVQFVEVVRYAPVALVEEEDGFVDYVKLQTQQGVRGPALITAIETRLRTYDIDPGIGLSTDRTVWVDANYIPPVVLTRTAERRAHPHGGPPGQLKKERGLQTGAEVVHGSKPGHGNRSSSAPVRIVERSSTRSSNVDREPKRKKHDSVIVKQQTQVSRGVSVQKENKGGGNKGNKGGGQGNDGKKGGGKGNGNGGGKKG